MKVRKTDTGIFTTVNLEAEDSRDVIGIFEALEQRNLERILKYYEGEALRILRAGGIESFPCNVPDNANPIVRDAHSLIYDIMAIRHWVKDQNAEWAAVCAFWAGYTAAAMEVRPYEPAARAGRAGSRNLERGRKCKKDRHAKDRARHEKWFLMADSLTGSFESTRAIAFHMAHRGEGNFNTIYSALKKRKK